MGKDTVWCSLPVVHNSSHLLCTEKRGKKYYSIQAGGRKKEANTPVKKNWESPLIFLHFYSHTQDLLQEINHEKDTVRIHLEQIAHIHYFSDN